MTGSRVLVVEDDAPLAATLERVLLAEGHEVELTGDGRDAVRRARARVPDLVVLDLMLPGADGITVCRRMRETAQFPILMLTALRIGNCRSEEHTSELQSRRELVCRLLLERKKNKRKISRLTNDLKLTLSK